MPRKIIVCDDDKDILEMLEIILSNDQTEVISVLNSLTLFAELDKHKPDLLLLDLWMPVLAGDQIVRQLRKQANYIDFPIIVMSASRDGKNIAFEAGASAYMEKPFNINELVGMVDEYVSYKKL